tara:strand:+ start:811 stop:1452 length:642 start_codon:yes stop_codon:yes gene_type:complete
MNSIKISNNLLHTKNHSVVNNDKVKISSAGGLAVIADSSPSPSVDLDNREGWLWEKDAGEASKFNYYMYGSTGSSHPWTLGDLKSSHVCCSVDKWDNGSSVPFIVIYTAMTGSGDAGSWYHSRRAYALNTSNHKILVGEHINLYSGIKPELPNNNRNIPLENKVDTGDCLDSEVISAISVHSDSAGLLGTKILVSNMGYNLNNEIKRDIKLIT